MLPVSWVDLSRGYLSRGSRGLLLLAIFASICDQKGADDPVVKRLSRFIKESGLSKMVYKTDQESDLRSTIDGALRRSGRSDIFESFEEVPEMSAVGKFASNGRAERAVMCWLIRDQKTM